MPLPRAASVASSMKNFISARPLVQYSTTSGTQISHTIFSPARKPSRIRGSFPAPRFCAE